jgi:holo-[acyl-carrier protein] synthase
MIVGVGIDIIEIVRIGRARERRGERFLSRVFTTGELEYSLSATNCDQHLAVRFAAKEAAFKALGTGLASGCRWRDVEVVVDKSGAPVLRLSGNAADLAARRGVSRNHLSLSHSAAFASAVVVLES